MFFDKDGNQVTEISYDNLGPPISEDEISMLLSDHAAGLVTSAADVADVLSLDLSLRERTTLDWYMGRPADAEGMLYILHYGGIVDDG